MARHPVVGVQGGQQVEGGVGASNLRDGATSSHAPPGSPTSIAIGTGITDMAPGSVQGLQMVVADIDAARAELVARGVDVSDVQHFPWGSFVFFSDPDGNGWAVQAIPRG